jgi:hypothetical protein
MKKLEEFVNEEKSSEYVYVLYYDDNTMYNYYLSEEDANKVKSEQEEKFPAFKLTVKKEPISNIHEGIQRVEIVEIK